MFIDIALVLDIWDIIKLKFKSRKAGMMNILHLIYFSNEHGENAAMTPEFLAAL